MKKMMQLVFICFSLFVMSFSFAATQEKTELSPIGFWKTIDDVSGKPKAIVQLWETPEKVLYGRVLKIYPQPGRDQNEVCSACEGENHNKRIVGLVILENLKQNKDEATTWMGGTILDPKNGKVYNSKIQVVENGRKLNVRGYIGTPLFGRTQTWIRVADSTNA